MTRFLARPGGETPPPSNRSLTAERRPSRVRFASDSALVSAILSGNSLAMAELHDRFAREVQRILWGILGPDQELADLHHDVFVRALSSLDRLKEPEALGGWMSSIAVHTAKACLEKRISRRRFWNTSPPAAEPVASSADPASRLDAREALRAIHAQLERLPTDERVAFALRHLEGRELSEVAEACEVSLATIKRRLANAERRFARLIESSPLLAQQSQKGSRRWTPR